MATIHQIAQYDTIELIEPIDAAPAGSRGGVLEFLEGGSVAEIEIMQPRSRRARSHRLRAAVQASPHPLNDVSAETSPNVPRRPETSRLIPTAARRWRTASAGGASGNQPSATPEALIRATVQRDV
jgi:hypothetical protein